MRWHGWVALFIEALVALSYVVEYIEPFDGIKRRLRYCFHGVTFAKRVYISS